ncbi:MAG: TetR/AcrR family transcriptional regulator [Solirubrobacterales bacterium]
MSESRRKPVQRRSRERVELILRTAAELVVEKGVDGVTTKEIAVRAEIPPSAIYGYFDGVDEIVGELVTRNLTRLDNEVLERLNHVERVNMRVLISALSDSYTDFHRERPENIPIWFSGGRSQVVRDKIDAQIHGMASWLSYVSVTAKFVKAPIPVDRIELLVSTFNHVFEYLFEHDYSDAGRAEAVKAYTEMIANYVELGATEAGIEGIPTADFIALITQGEQT